ncbi:MAG: baseplate J/gp47 family protein [Treponema sp.]|jgi:uncharacterized phage protein gp47/JayE|nr:baseplate J/gp47 family protein [Treponema sp.]
MRDTWIDADDETIRDDIVKIAKEKTGLTNFKSAGVLRGILEVLIACVSFIYRTSINAIYKNATLDGATGFFLTCWGLKLGVARKQETKAAGNFTGYSFGDGNIPEGAWIVVDGTELRYKVTQKVSFQADTDFPIPVIAEFAGSNYNIGAQIRVRITRVIPGLDSVSVGDGWIRALGESAESDDSYRERVKNRWRSQTLGDTKETYRYYAESVHGVRSAKIIRVPRYPGSTDVVISSVIGLPNEELLEAVKAALHDHELMAFDVRVKPPEETNVEVIIEYSGSPAEADIELIAEAYVYNLGIGGRFKIADLYKLFDPLKLDTIEIISPERDVPAGEAAIIVATTITVTKNGAPHDGLD